jgi:hypothetical protein
MTMVNKLNKNKTGFCPRWAAVPTTYQQCPAITKKNFFKNDYDPLKHLIHTKMQ